MYSISPLIQSLHKVHKQESFNVYLKVHMYVNHKEKEMINTKFRILITSEGSMGDGSKDGFVYNFQ